MNATGRFATTFENPIFDTDDDDGDWKEEEAEITAKSTAFPSVNQNYYAEAQFSHWYYQCGGGCQFLWDPDGGRVDYRSQISYWLVAEYESHRSSGIYRRVTYPYQAPPSGAASSPDEAGAPVPTHEGTVADVQGIQVLLEPDARDLDVRAISTPQLQDLVRANAKRTAILMGEEGPYRAIVTFAVPLSPVAFEDLIDDVKMSISSFEAIGPADGGQIMTIGGDLALLDVLPKWFADRGAVLDGVVAADVLLEGAADLQRLASSPSIFLIDVAPEVLARQLGDELPSRLESYRDRFDILVNDVYWQQAGIGGS